MKYLLLVSLAAFSCTHKVPANAISNWQNLDLQKDGFFGVSTDEAYKLLDNKTATDVVVAVIDSGIDTTQPDLKPVLWTDPLDGSHGRNYIGPEEGKEDFIPMLASGGGVVLDDLNLHIRRLEGLLGQLKESKRILEQIERNTGPSFDDFMQYRPRSDSEAMVTGLVRDRMPLYPDFSRLKYSEMDHLIELGEYHLRHGLSRVGTWPDSCASEGFDANIATDPLGLAPDPNLAPSHGTYVAGIIAAVRNNGTGIDGVSNHTRILMLKLYDNIREMRNADLAAAIRYAVDHGARIINMSFGKRFSFHREAVDSAVKYAMDKDVLIVHSAGNDGLNTDTNSFFPMGSYQDGGIAPAWLTVGASGFRDDNSLAATFSNYGRQTVDVFAPGVGITSVTPHSGLATWDGTSQAAPIVAGIAALIRSYYPKLTAVQVKDIIMRSVVSRKVLKDKCVSGGVVNAYNALKMAAGY